MFTCRLMAPRKKTREDGMDDSSDRREEEEDGDERVWADMC
jgi:hypothetical protein